MSRNGDDTGFVGVFVMTVTTGRANVPPTVVLNHTHQIANLQSTLFYSAQPRERMRKLFITTVTLDAAIAADAIIGDSRPNAASGIPITL